MPIIWSRRYRVSQVAMKHDQWNMLREDRWVFRECSCFYLETLTPAQSLTCHIITLASHATGCTSWQLIIQLLSLHSVLDKAKFKSLSTSWIHMMQMDLRDASSAQWSLWGTVASFALLGQTCNLGIKIITASRFPLSSSAFSLLLLVMSLKQLSGWTKQNTEVKSGLVPLHLHVHQPDLSRFLQIFC